MALLLAVEFGVRSIGDEHVAGRVEDGQRRLGLDDDRLRRHPACPEHGHLAFRDANRIAEVRRAQIGDAQRCRDPRCAPARRASTGTEPRSRPRERRHPARTVSSTRPAAPERAGADAAAIGHVHRNVDALPLMRQRKPGGGKRPFERERAAEQETHQIVAPVAGHICRLVDELAVLETRGSAGGRSGGRRPARARLDAVTRCR